jgi:hypothetical protein
VVAVTVNVGMGLTETTALPLVPATVRACAPEGSAIFAEVAIVIVTFCEWTPSRVTLEGLKVHDAPEGNPAVQPPAGETPELKFTAPLKLFTGVTVITEVAGCPAATVRVAGLRDKVKGTVTVMPSGTDVEAL